MFDAIFQGQPTTFPAPVGTTVSGVDTANQNLYLTNGNGWVPAAPSTLAKNGLLAQVANVASVLTFAVPSNLGGAYQVSIYEISANTPTAATLPAVTVVFTDKDTGGSITDTLADVASVAAPNVVNAGTFVIHPKGGTNVVIATTSYAAGSGTALSYNIHARVTYLG